MNNIVYVMMEEFCEGRKFNSGVCFDVYKDKTSAKDALKQLANNAILMFSEVYSPEFISVEWNKEEYVEIHSKDYEDMWSGCVIQKEIKERHSDKCTDMHEKSVNDFPGDNMIEE